jgi:hypothetical protein
MAGILDLSDYETVKRNANGVFERLADGSMPADETGPWPSEWTSLFKRWIEEGCAP